MNCIEFLKEISEFVTNNKNYVGSLKIMTEDVVRVGITSVSDWKVSSGADWLKKAEEVTEFFRKQDSFLLPVSTLKPLEAEIMYETGGHLIPCVLCLNPNFKGKSDKV